MQQTNIEVKKKTGEINAAIESGISGIRTAKAFANENAEEEKFAEANEHFKASKVSCYKAMGLFNGGVEATVGIMARERPALSLPTVSPTSGMPTGLPS